MSSCAIALDLGATTGFYDGQKAEKLTLPKGCPLLALYEAVERVEGGSASAIAVEAACFQKGYAGGLYWQKLGVVKLYAERRGIDLVLLHSATVKRIFTGAGDADKQKVIDKCLSLGVDLPFKGRRSKAYDDNAADAVAIYHAYMYGLTHGAQAITKQGGVTTWKL